MDDDDEEVGEAAMRLEWPCFLSSDADSGIGEAAAGWDVVSELFVDVLGQCTRGSLTLTQCIESHLGR